LEEQGKALCIHDGGGYPNIYSAKTIDVMSLIKDDISNICSPDETLIIELWDLS
jgi:hypothetical protein